MEDLHLLVMLIALPVNEELQCYNTISNSTIVAGDKSLIIGSQETSGGQLLLMVTDVVSTHEVWRACSRC